MAEEPAPPPEETPPAEPTTAPAPEDRAKNLYYIGETDPVTNEPIQYVLGVPARDLSADEIKLLRDADYVTALDAGIYSTSKPKKPAGGG